MIVAVVIAIEAIENNPKKNFINIKVHYITWLKAKQFSLTVPNNLYSLNERCFHISTDISIVFCPKATDKSTYCN